MSFWIIVVIIVALIILLGAARCIYELHSLEVARYELVSPKITGNKKILFLADLHSRIYGENNEKLVNIIKNEHPDLILIGGDILVSNKPEKDKIAREFLRQLPAIGPVYFANGNHEKALEALGMFKNRNENWQKFLADNGIRNLKNESVNLGSITVSGLDVDYQYYKKIRPKKLTAEALNQYLAKCTQNSYNILMSHDPGNFKAIASWAESCCRKDSGSSSEKKPESASCDLVLSGHYHGGSIRLPKLGGVISPQFRIFPNYSKGIFKNGNTTMIVTGGAGSHTVNLRIFNKPEVVVIDIRSEN